MKSITSNLSFFSNVGKPQRKPLRTFKEMTDEFGVSPGVLMAALRDEGAPSAEMQHFGKNSGNNRWYEPVAMRRWWALRTEKIGSSK